MEDFIRKNYKNPEKVIRLYHSEHDKLEKNFSKKYAKADVMKFAFQVDINKDGTLESSKVFFQVNASSAFDIESKEFTSNPKFTKYLYSGSEAEPWPKVWSDGGSKPEFTRLKLPEDPLTKCDSRRCGIPDDIPTTC